MGQTIHHETFDSKMSPVCSLAQRVHHILENGGTMDSYICEDWDGLTFQTVTPNNLITSIRVLLGLDKAGINPDLVGVHSL